MFGFFSIRRLLFIALLAGGLYAMPDAHGTLRDLAQSLMTGGSGAGKEHIPGPLPMKLLAVIDGDTVAARVAIWPGQEIKTKVRLRGIDAPELKARCARERAGALAAKDALARLVRGQALALANVGPDKYAGRVVADIRLADGRDVSTLLLRSKLVRKYGGGHRDGWCGV